MTLALLAIFLGQGIIRPPMHRVWTVISGEQTELRAERNGIGYYSSAKEVSAIETTGLSPTSGSFSCREHC